MDLFVSRIALNEEVTQENIWQLIVSWLKGSQHYGINEVQQYTDGYSEQTFNSTQKLAVLSTNFGDENILACKFDYEEDNNIWCISVIFSDKKDRKSICINLSCKTSNYDRGSIKRKILATTKKKTGRLRLRTRKRLT